LKPVAVVTGSAGGLGRAVTAELEGRGFQVVGLSRSTGSWSSGRWPS
jgi:NAD(P)-dependent dehydrogenase (short-subunit alcohol dehydrogenase family)